MRQRWPSCGSPGHDLYTEEIVMSRIGDVRGSVGRSEARQVVQAAEAKRGQGRAVVTDGVEAARAPAPPQATSQLETTGAVGASPFAQLAELAASAAPRELARAGLGKAVGMESDVTPSDEAL